MVDIGRADVAVEISLLLIFLVQTRIEHLEHVFNIFSYLKSHPKSKLVMNPEPMDLGSMFASIFRMIMIGMSFMEALRRNCHHVIPHQDGKELS